MLLSFDTSRMVLSATGNAQGPLKSIDQRRRLMTDNPVTVWGYGSFTSVENSRNRTGDGNRYDGDVWGYNIGVDYRNRPDIVTGISLGYSETDLTTAFNAGTYDETALMLSPYVIFMPKAGITLSAIAEYTVGDVDRTRDTAVPIAICGLCLLMVITGSARPQNGH